MGSPLADLQPRLLWRNFDGLRSVPRPSQHEGKVLAHVKHWAAERKLEVRQDAVGNLCVRVPATPGHEGARTVVLQGHLDMVPEKDHATTFDFLTDGIPVRVDGDWVVADHTTLGADNGIGVAAALAAAEDRDLVHGPLEVLLTVDEETALTGACGLDGGLVAGRVLINLDSEEDGVLFVGCAGGCTTEINFGLDRASPPSGYVPLQIEVGGLKGGHSGLLIHENRGDSLKVLARVLDRLVRQGPVLVDVFEGGNKDNAIPREASAVVYVSAKLAADCPTTAEAVRREILAEISGVDPDLTIQVRDGSGATGRPGDTDCSSRLIALLVGLPHGVVAMSRDIAGLTETSTNLGVARTESDRVVITCSSRSSVESAQRRVLDQINAVSRLAGAGVTELNEYPGWQPNMDSALLRVCVEASQELRGSAPKITAIHAGLECGIIGERLGGDVDMISFGPQIEGVHAPGERVHIPSVARFWELLGVVLKKLA